MVVLEQGSGAVLPAILQTVDLTILVNNIVMAIFFVDQRDRGNKMVAHGLLLFMVDMSLRAVVQ